MNRRLRPEEKGKAAASCCGQGPWSHPFFWISCCSSAPVEPFL
uniref:Uncharacterized protein n=1 Tax=Arundo donax TaxID=35708 RepID=A0A0A9BYE4_ARUDO